MSFSAKHLARQPVRHLVSKKTSKRRIAWLLLASFLFQAALPLLAQAASTQAEGDQLPFCTMQGFKLVSLSGDADQPQQDIASSTQLCPACLLYHLAQISMPVADGLPSVARLQQDSWFPPATSGSHNHTRVSHTPIRAPPQA